ncbi:MAG: ABC transporter ATP-binding protein, partial [Thaumarchaeota archaeon]|nr:ABC transporter ATP-binding protein [Nitrososphaerota archaeon]
MLDSLMEVKSLCLHYSTRKGIVKAVDDISFNLKKGETVSLVGESGCGKSSLARALMRLLPKNVAKYDGSIFIDGMDIVTLRDDEFKKKIRWKKMSIVFQGAMDSLNPLLKVGEQVAEPLVIHGGIPEKDAIEKALELLSLVGISRSFIDRYPFELSGGMQQRVLIAMALVTNPEIVILDEPTSALDVITQANIMNMLKDIKSELKISYIFITHDIALSTELSDRIAIMYAGKIVELTSLEDFLSEPLHPYAKLLLASVPTLRSTKKLSHIPGEPPSLLDPPPGCRFHPRCPHAMDVCRREEPPEVEASETHKVKCWL